MTRRLDGRYVREPALVLVDEPADSQESVTGSAVATPLLEISQSRGAAAVLATQGSRLQDIGTRSPIVGSASRPSECRGSGGLAVAPPHSPKPSPLLTNPTR
jgi:hypothetical protein